MTIPRRTLLATGTAALLPRRAKAASGSIKLGHIVPLSGVFKSISEPGAAAVDIAVREVNAAGGINGLTIQVARYEDNSDPAQAAVAARKLIEDDKVLAIAGPFSSGETAVASATAERAHIAMVPNASSRPGIADGHKYLWALSSSELVTFGRVLTSLEKRGEKPKSAQIIYVSDEPVAADAGNKTYPAVLKKFDIPFGSPVAVQYKSFDMSPQVAKVLDDKPDVVAVAGVPDSAAKILRELRRQGFKGRMIGSSLFADPNNDGLLSDDGEGTVFCSLFWQNASPIAQRFNAAYLDETNRRGLHKVAAFQTDAFAYDSVYLLAKAMQTAGVTGDPAKLDGEREAINAALADAHIDGALGSNIHFNGHYGALPNYVIEIRNKAWVLFDTFPAES
jgi:branched-chain amino acid transport system substrate-binding protein